MNNRQTHELSSTMKMQVFTSLCAAAYTVEVNDLTPDGAFVKTEHLPELGETISFNFYDRNARFIHHGNAKVLDVIKSDSGDSGFSIEFATRIVDDSFNKIVH